MLTKTQKKEQVSLASDSIKNSKAVIFADFSGISDTDTKELKRQLREQGAQLKVLKKRLLKVALEKAGIQFDPLQEERLLATIFSEKDLTAVAGILSQFSKKFKDDEAKHFEVLDVYDAERSALIGQKEFMLIASLPTRDVLIAMIMGGISGPMRAFLSILKQLSEKAPIAPEVVEEAKEESPTKAEDDGEKVVDTEEKEKKE